jgi:hypothetical protein
VGLGAALLLTAVACASTQVIPLEVSPHPVTLYVDGEELAALPGALELRSDRDHTLFFKSEGHQASLVVLRSVRHEGGARLEPAQVRVRLRSLSPRRRDLRIEREEEVSAPPDGAAEEAHE